MKRSYVPREDNHEPTAVKRDLSNIKEDAMQSEEESCEKLRRSGMIKGTDKAQFKFSVQTP